MIMTNALHRNNDEDNPHPKGSGSTKWRKLLSPIWHRKKGGVYLFPKKKEGYEERELLLFRVTLTRC